MEKSRRSKFYSVSADTASQEIKTRRDRGEVVVIDVQYIPTIENSLSTTRVRQRLCDLMGTDVIRLNDKRYFQQLSERLQDEYESSMDKQEDARSAAEDQRLRRLMLEGVINTPTDFRAIVHGERAKKSAKKKKKRKSKKRTSDGTPAYTSGEQSTRMSRDSDDEYSEKDLVTQVSFMSDSRPSSSVGNKPKRPQSGILHTRSPSPTKKNSSDKENDRNELHARPPHHDSFRASSSCSTHRKSRRIKSASSRLVHWDQEKHSDESDEGGDDRYDTKSLPGRTKDRPPSKFSKQEPDTIKTLRREETVAGLYSLAEELVSPIKTDQMFDNRKVITKAPKQKTMTVKF